MTTLDPGCERARCLVSLRLDGEATPFEEAFVASHLEACPACRAHAAAVAASTEAIRSTPLLDGHDVPALPRPRRRPLRHLQVAAAAVVLVGAGLTGLAGIQQLDRDRASRPPRPAYLDSAAYELQIIRQLPPPSVGRGGLVTVAT